MFAETFYGTQMTSIPENLFSGITGTAPGLFAGTFWHADKLTNIPVGLFSTIVGTVQPFMFEATFTDTTSMTKIPDGLFGGLTGAPALYAFKDVFRSSGLTALPNTMFPKLSGKPGAHSFHAAFATSSKLAGYVPSTLFAGLDSTDYSGGPMASIFTGTALATTCPTGTTVYTTGFEADWQSRVSCITSDTIAVNCAAGQYIKQGATTCTTCPAGSYCTGGTYSIASTGATADTGMTFCPVDTYNPSTGQSSESACKECGHGSYTDSTPGPAGCIACDPGYIGTSAGSEDRFCQRCDNDQNVNAYVNTNVTWNSSTNTVTNLCKIAACSSGYTLISNANVCALPTYYIAYNANGGTGTTATTTCTYGQKCTAAQNGFTNGTKQFLGWSFEGPTGNPEIAGGQAELYDFTYDNETYTLYAVWGDCTACNAGTGANCTLTAPAGVCTYTTSCQTGYHGIVNNGKYNPSCTPNTYYVDFDTTPDACDDFHGVADLFILEYGNDAYDTLQVGMCDSFYDANGVYHMPTASKTGYDFRGWYTEKNGKGMQLADSTGKISDSVPKTNFGDHGAGVTAYANWSPKGWWIQFDTSPDACDEFIDMWYLEYDDDAPDTLQPSVCENLYDSDGIYHMPIASQTGYTFAGWYTGENGTGIQLTDATGKILDSVYTTDFGGDGNLTAYAKWTPATYKVTLDKQDGTGGTSEYYYQYNTKDKCYYYTTSALSTCTDGSEGKYITQPGRTGYAFGGYWTGKNGTGTQYVNVYGGVINNLYKTLASDITLYAQWTPIVYTVKFDGGSGSNPTITTIYEKYNTGWYSDAATNNEIKKITALTKDGYTFGGFFTDYKYTTAVVNADGTLASPLFTGSNGSTSIIFTASKWTAKQYHVQFDSNNGYGGASSATATYDATMDTLTSLPTRPGYAFAGYFDAKTGGTKYYNADGTAARTWNKAADTTLYAQWTIETYTITYNLNGGTNPAGAPSNYTVETATFDLPTPTRAGTSDADYGFLGWYENSGLTGNAVTQILFGTTGNKTYWASWAEIKRPVSQSVKCDAGTYIAAGATTCTTCTAGYACAGGSYTIPKDGATSDTGRVQCTGATYAAAGAAQCTSCPSPYTYDTSAGKTKAEQCTVQTSEPDNNTGWYIKDAKGGRVSCPAGYYCPSTIVAYGSTNSPVACPSPTTYAPTTWPTNYRNPTVENSSIFASGSPTAATGCMAQYLLKNDAGKIFVLNNYNDKTQKYDVDAGSTMGYDGYYMWYVSLNPGYYFTKKWQYTVDGTTMDWCDGNSSGSDVPKLWQDVATCPAGSYCPGYDETLDMFADTPVIPDSWPKCGDGEYTDTMGINACPTAYANSAAKSSAIEQCYLTTTAGKYVATARADQVQCLANNYCAGGTTVNYGSTGGMQSCATGYESTAGASKCNAITYTITYNLDGGAAPKANPTTYTVETPTITLADPYKAGYTFAGWYSDAAFTTRVTQIANGSTGNKTLWAKWTTDTYHINYVLNNGTNDPRNPTTFTGTDATLHIYPATRTGYTMDGWGSEIIGELFAPDVDIENPYMDFDLQAQWTANTYTITLDVNGGTGGLASVTVTYDAVLPTLTQLPTKANWTFTGYFDAATGGVQYYDASGHPTSTAKWNKTNGMTLYAQYAQDVVSCLRGRYYNGTSMVQCPAGMYCPGTGSVDAGVAGCGAQCPTSHANSAAGAASANECFTSCTEYSLVGGTAVPASPRVNYPAACTFNGVSDTGNPCDIVDGRCVEKSCKSDYELISGRCTPCDREHALSYKTTGNCVVASCEPGFHPDSRQCVENTMECYAPNAVSAVREWDSRTNSFTICRITECESGFHIMSNACISDIQPCTLENGTGTKEWNHTTGAYGECVASECAPGYTNDPYDSHNPGAQCGECKNKYDAAGNQVASTYVRGCEIASCMYQGEKYALDGGECVSICDEHSDETGSMKWNGKKCIRTCNDGYMPW